MTAVSTPPQSLPADSPTFDCRVDFADELAQLAREDERVVAICNDSVGSSNLTAFRDEFPDRLLNVGIAEQDLVGVAAGLANSGLIPFVCAAAPFLTGRATEQIKADVAYSERHVVLCGQSPGMAYGELGPTHHSIEDLSWMRAVAGLPVVVPAGPRQTRSAVRWAASLGRGSYLRIPRFKVPEVSTPEEPFAPGRAIELRAGRHVTVVAIGSMVSRALWAAEALADEGIEVRVLNMPFVEPFDSEALLSAARETGGIVSVEEATISGGLGAAVASFLSQQYPAPMRILGIDNAFAPTGSASYLLDHFGLNVEGIVRAVRDLRGGDDV